MRESTNGTWERPPFAFCEECLAYGTDGIILRICVSCGHVGCAEGSPRNHAAEHYAETDHAIAAAVGPSTPPRWSYSDDRPS